MCVILKDTGKIQMRATHTEIDSWFSERLNKFCQIISFSQPREDAVTVPAIGNHALVGQIARNVPAMFFRIVGYAEMEPGRVPTWHEKDVFLLVHSRSDWQFKRCKQSQYCIAREFYGLACLCPGRPLL